MISVIIPVYNAEATLRRCLDSVLAQSYKDIEIILVDDGSTDGSGKICDEYGQKDDRVRVLHQANSGVSAARNAGLDVAKGEWVAFCDSDDSVNASWIEKMVEASSSAGLVIGGYRKYLPDGTVEYVTLGRTRIYTEPDDFFEDCLNAHILKFIWNKLFSKKIIDEHKIRFDETFKVFEDEYFVLEFLVHVPEVICIPDCGYNYFYPADYFDRYDFSIDDFQKVILVMYRILAKVNGRLRIPQIVYWYNHSLRRFAHTHTFEETRERIEFGRDLAISFHDKPLNYWKLRFLPARAIYWILRRQELNRE